MRRPALLLIYLAACVAFLATAGIATAAKGAAPAPPKVLAIHFSADINPVTQDWLTSRLDRAVKEGYGAVVIVLDTPGGLQESMRKIVATELALPIPVLVWVGPGGARAASAGVWISQAADYLAMAPNTNIGSSTPIDGSGANIASDLRRKVVNDAAASLRGLARTHGRNVAWADAAVRSASNLTADEALKAHVVDAIAADLPSLLRSVDGVKTRPRNLVLHTAGATLDNSSPGFITRFLSTLLDPNLVSLLFLAGLLGVGFEIFHPGVVLPGALGAVSLLTALFGLSILPLSWGGLALVALGVGLLIADLHVPTHGAFTVSGLVALAVGLTTLFNGAPAPYRTSAWLVATITVVAGGFWSVAVAKGLAARRLPIEMAPDELVGLEGVVRDGGFVFVHGELWHAESAAPLQPGDRVLIESQEGLTLHVRPA
jgi:membrane-bound serine protease (ClpP class)